MLNRVRPEVLGTVECIWAPENSTMPPTSHTTRTCGSRSTGSVARGCLRVSDRMCFDASLRPLAFHS
jgi:hypothetical protein